MAKFKAMGDMKISKTNRKNQRNMGRTIEISTQLYKKLAVIKIMKDEPHLTIKKLANIAIKHSIDDGTI